MAKITLNINGNIDDAQRKIAIIKRDLKSIEQFKIKISVDASGVEALDKSVLKSANAFAKLTNAQARLTKAQADLINAQTRAAESAARMAKAAETAAAAQGKTAANMDLTVENAGRLTVAVNQAAQAYDQLAAAQNRAQSGGTSGGLSNDTQTGLAASSANGGGFGRSIVYDVPNLAESAALPSHSWAETAADINETARAAQNAGSAFETMRNGASTAWETLKQGGKVAGVLGDSLGNVVLKMAAWQVLGDAIARPIAAFREALSTMKSVEQQLKNIEKLGTLPAAEISKIGESAYDTASKFGIAADKYLESVYRFQKAGLSDSAEELAQLATKITLVGDTTQEIADTFLISANAAWKFGGDIERLSYLVDVADKLNNNYAVSLADIATALPIVGATAAQVGLTAEQTMSAVSAIVATTGQSASKAATAFRAILMNLIGETGELEDGISVTEESIASLNAVLNKYASESLRAAEAQGKILDPMEAVAALAKAAEDGFLNEAQLFEVLSGLGGKLRTTQLTALVNNTELYNAMLRDTADAAGTADAEVSTMLTSWESKTQILENTFTRFVSHLIDTNGIKAGIDLLTGLVEVLDSGVGKFAALTGVVYGVMKAFALLSSTGAVKFIGDLVSGVSAANVAFGQLFILMSQSPMVWAVGFAAAIYGIVKVSDALNVTFEERLALLDEASQKYDEEAGALDELNGKLAENQKLLEAANETGASEAYKNRLVAENEELARQITLQEERARKAKEAEGREAAALLSYKNYFIDEYQFNPDNPNATMGDGRFVDMVEYAEHLLEVSEAEGKVNDELLGLISTLTETKDKLDPLSDAYGVYAGRIDAVVAGAADLVSETKRLTAATEENTAATEDSASAQQENAEAVATAQDATDKLAASAKATSAALKDFGEYGGLTSDAMKGLTEAMGNSLDALFDETGALNNAGTAAFETASEFEHAKDAAAYLQAAAQAANYANLIAQIQAAGAAAVVSTQQIAAMLQAVGMSANIADAQIRGMKRTAAEKGTSLAEELLGYVNTNGILETLRKQADEIARKAPKSGSTGSGGKSSATDKSGKEKDEELEARKAEVSLEKQRLSFLEASGAADNERIAKMQDIQAALHAQAEYLSSIGASEEDIKALSTEWWTIQSKIQDIYDAQAKTELERYKNAVSFGEKELSYLEAAGASDSERIAKLRDIQAALQAQEIYLRSINAAEDDILDVATKRKKIEKDIADIYEEQKKAAKQAFYDYADAQKKALENMRDAALAPLKAQLDALNAQRDAVEEQRKEQEKLLAVEEARRALENAQNQRNVRQFNSDTEQWEWVADSRAVEDAKRAIIDAEKALADYHAEQLYRAQKKAVEDQIAATQEAFEAQRDAWTEAAELVRSGAMSVEEAMIYASQAIQDAAGQISSMAFSGAAFGGTSSGGSSSNSKSGSSGGGTSYSQKMPDMSRNTALAGKTVYSNGMNVTYDENGYATKATNPNHSNYEGTTMSAQAQSKEDALAGKSYTPDYTGLVDWNGGNPDYSRKYDAGGVLHGLGGIKETPEDELILPPDLTKAILSPALTQNVANQIQKLGVLTGARPMTPGVSMPEASVNRIGTQNNGDTYQVYFNGMQVPNVTQGTTIGELARMAKAMLPISRS